jgi:hypothetical protein
VALVLNFPSLCVLDFNPLLSAFIREIRVQKRFFQLAVAVGTKSDVSVEV